MREWTVEAIPVGQLQTNAYLLIGPGGKCVLVDPGDEAEILLARIDAAEGPLAALLCTHAHFDHVAAAAAIQERWNLPLLCHPEGVALLRRMPDSQRNWGFPATAVPWWEDSLYHGQILEVAGGQLEVRHVPGHAPGHVLFFREGDALVGDCVFAGSIGRTDLPGGDFALLERSIREQIYTLPLTTTLWPGHGPATTVEREKRTNPFVR